jgi:hypothetical protein
MGGAELFGEWVLGHELRQRVLRFEWFFQAAVPGFAVSVLGTTLLRVKAVAPGRLLAVAFSSVGVLAILLPLVVVAFFERHSEDLSMCYLIALFLLSSILWTLKICARPSNAERKDET